MSRSRILLIALIALTVAGLACSAAQRTPTPAPTPIPTATEPPEATATSAPTPKPVATSTKVPVAPTATKASAVPTAAPASAGVLFNDDFSSQTASEDNGWDFDSTDNVDRAWSANKYTLSVKKKNYLGYGTPNGEYNDFGAEIEAQASSAYAKYGIRFRSQGGSDNPSYYVFVVSTDGKYYVDKLLNDEWADVSPVPTTASQQINKGKVKNTLGVLAEGSTISLYINRHLVKTFTDDSIDSGLIGVLAGPGDNDSAEVTFSRLTILTAEKAKADWAAVPATVQPAVPATVQPAATATKTSGGGSGNGTITVRNTFPGACQINVWGPKEAVIRAEGNSSKSMSLPPGKYGVHVAADVGEVDLSNLITLPPGGYCVITCNKATKSVGASCGQ